MWKPWQQVSEWSRASNEGAISNARTATTTCSRARVEREEVEHFLARQQRLRTVSIGTSTRPA